MKQTQRRSLKQTQYGTTEPRTFGVSQRRISTINFCKEKEHFDSQAESNHGGFAYRYVRTALLSKARGGNCEGQNALHESSNTLFGSIVAKL